MHLMHLCFLCHKAADGAASDNQQCGFPQAHALVLHRIGTPLASGKRFLCHQKMFVCRKNRSHHIIGEVLGAVAGHVGDIDTLFLGCCNIHPIITAAVHSDDLALFQALNGGCRHGSIYLTDDGIGVFPECVQIYGIVVGGKADVTVRILCLQELLLQLIIRPLLINDPNQRFFHENTSPLSSLSQNSRIYGTQSILIQEDGVQVGFFQIRIPERQL